MKICVEGFKSIKTLTDFDFLPLTLLAGANSSGKTSLIQCLLLLKQTLESESKEVLSLNGTFLKTASAQDLVFEKKNRFGISITMESSEISNIKEWQDALSNCSDKAMQSINLAVEFHANSTVRVENIKLTIYYEDNSSQFLSFDRVSSGQSVGRYKMSGNDKLLFSCLPTVNRPAGRLSSCSLSFTNFFPLYAEFDSDKLPPALPIVLMKVMITSLQRWMEHLTYVGPIRVKPEPYESFLKTPDEYVGIDGRQTRFVLFENRKKIVSDDGKTLEESVKDWMCKRWGLAKDLSVKKETGNLYRIILRNNAEVDVDISHMGLGVSQVLPIIVQGLLTPKGGTLIVEAPEVHMHPSIQCGLMDFFICLKKEGRHIVIETHSEHIITRLRRRIAEEAIDATSVNLCFVSNNGYGSEYETLPYEDGGRFFKEMPKDFLSELDGDFRAIIASKLNAQ